MAAALFQLCLFCSVIALVAFFSGAAGAEAADSGVSLSQAQASIKNSQDAINHLQTIGMGTQRLDDLLQDAELSLQRGEYGRVVRIGEEIIVLQNKAIMLQNIIVRTKETIGDARSLSLNVSAIEGQFTEGMRDFEAGNYEHAESMFQQSSGNATELLRGELLILENTVDELATLLSSNGLQLATLAGYSESVKQKLSANDITSILPLKEEIREMSDAVHSIVEARESLLGMQGNNITSSRADDLFAEAVLAAELGNFKRAKDAARELQELEKKSSDAAQRLGGAKETLSDFSSQGVDVQEAEALLQEAYSSFAVGNYEDAQSLADSALRKAEGAKKDSLLFGAISKSQLRFNLLPFFKKYWWLIAGSVALLAFSGVSVYRASTLHLLRLRIGKLKREETTIISLIKKYQEEYFRKKKMSKDSYDAVVDQHQERLLEIKETLPLLESRLAEKENKSAKKEEKGQETPPENS